MHRTILMAALVVTAIISFAGSECALASQSSGAGAGKITFEHAYDDDGYYGD